MNKRIIITALSIMLASSTIMPAYAALPANASTDIGNGSSQDERVALNYWADQYTDELNKIENPKDRYRRAVELVVTNWDPVKELLVGQALVDSYMRGEIGGGQAAYLVKRMCDNTGIEAIKGGYLQNGYPNEATYVRIDGTVYCYSRAALELWGMDDKYVFIDHNFNGIEIGNPFEPEQDEVVLSKSTFLTFTDMYTSIHVYDTDGTLYTAAAMNIPMVQECQASGHPYYKCVNSQFIAITEEEAIALGYVEE